MTESIYSIPINEVFEKRNGCPICGIYEMLQERCIEYIMGPAMMESKIRMETNKTGFCYDHLVKMLEKQNKLSVALMLETHFDELETKHVISQVRGRKSPTPPVYSCFVCNEVDTALDNMIENVITLYTTDPNFRYQFRKQPYYCYPHYEMLCKKASDTLVKKNLEMFMDDITEITRSYMLELKHDVRAYANMADYRSSRIKPELNAVTSLERAVLFLKSRKAIVKHDEIIALAHENEPVKPAIPIDELWPDDPVDEKSKEDAG